MKKVNILGSEWMIEIHKRSDDSSLDNADGYCDKTTKTIVVIEKDGDLGNFEVYQKKIMRHEIIHAFMFESGLGECWEKADRWGQDETTVDWFAYQFPKIHKAFTEAGCL